MADRQTLLAHARQRLWMLFIRSCPQVFLSDPAIVGFDMADRQTLINMLRNVPGCGLK